MKSFVLSMLVLSLITAAGPFASGDVVEDFLQEKEQTLTETQLEGGGFTPLFTGDNLDAWNVEPGHVGHWTIEDGIINYDGRAEQKKNHDKSLWTKKSYGASLFYCEWRFADAPKMKPHPIVLWNGDFLRDDQGKRITQPRLDAGDSGILFRGILDCQANIWCQEMGSGEINGYRVNRKWGQKLRRSCIPLVNADKPLGEWNAFLISLVDDQMTVYLNGQEVLVSEPLPDLPTEGPIGLQHHGDRIQFRNLWVKELQ